MRPTLDTQGTIAIDRSRVLDYLTLTKPELTLLSVLTALAGFYLGISGPIHGLLLVHTLLGTALVGGGAGALNQYMERHYDALMRRTEKRPLPAGRLSPVEVLVFGVSIATIGILQLALLVNILTGFLAVVTLTTYLFLYTPLKRITALSTLVGGIPGALPPVMGWTAARNEITVEAWVLFGILFFWQMPHFLSLAWMYRKDYARAGYRLLTVGDPDGGSTTKHILVHTSALLLISLLPTMLGHLGLLYLVVALLLGLVFLLISAQLFVARSNAAARRLFIASLLYLPALLIVMVVDKL